jgi:hypothetical protein
MQAVPALSGTDSKEMRSIPDRARCLAIRTFPGGSGLLVKINKPATATVPLTASTFLSFAQRIDWIAAFTSVQVEALIPAPSASAVVLAFRARPAGAA